MEKLLSPYEKHYMKMAMLKHEETFKQQVYELHRLYQVQKILMKNMKIDKSNRLTRVDRPVSCPGGGGESGGNSIETMEESEIELTLGPSCYGGELIRKKKKKNSSPEIMDEHLHTGGRSFSLSSSTSSSSNNNHNNLEEQVRQETLMKHQKQKQSWLQALTLDVI